MRDYDPTTGRYIQADPLGLVDGASVYGYALQNPGRFTDPTGEFVPQAAAACLLIPACRAAAGAAAGVAWGWLTDDDECYTAIEALSDAAAGAFVLLGPKPRGLRSNPFKGKSDEQIDKFLTKRGYQRRGDDPQNGVGSYYNPKTGRSFHIDRNHKPGKIPHAGTHRARGKGKPGAKRKGRQGKDYPL